MEYRGSCHDHIGTGLQNGVHIVQRHAAVHLDIRRKPPLIQTASQNFNFFRHIGNIFLTAKAGTVATRRLLLEKLWDMEGNFVDDHTLTVTMNRLRAKIEDGRHTYIQTIRGMGYVWTGAQE